SADLSLAKIDSPDPVGVGSSLTYTLTATNTGPSVASNVTVTDTLPSGVTYASGSAGCVLSGSIVTCTGGTVTVGSSTTFTIVVTVNSSVADGTVLTNTAIVSATEPDPVTSNNSASATTTVQNRADLSI